MSIRRLGLIVLSTLGVFVITEGFAGEPCTPWVAQIVSIQGQVESKRAEQSQWQPVDANQFFCVRDSVRVEANSRAALRLRNETMLRLDQGTTITFSEIVSESPSWLDLVRGAVHFISRVPRTLKIKTPFVNAAIEGTEFVVRVESNGTEIWVFEGQVLASNAAGRLTLTTGQAAITKPGQPPVRQLAVRPRDAVQWALYYPPIQDYRPGTFAPSTSASTLEDAVSAYRQGDVAAALARLEAVSADLRDAQFFTLRAGMFLSVGRVDEALADIRQAREREAGTGVALALSSVIALLRNEKDAAFTYAQRAVELEPQSPVPRIARSYAYQARFDIENALQDVQEAVRLAPDNALASARLAELWLSLGDLDRALHSARKAVASDPELARTQTVLGFAHLTRIEVDAAKESFQKAIALDQAAPLPRLGLGLATIREGRLAEGRQEIEIAASLDPNNSLIRSYLGKAYFEEKRDKLAATELAAAKGLDPQDPTPWFYDAIRKQTENRPVEALHDLQRSIELNDNRAVYRSRLLLDEDLAARSASLGRIYGDLGFEKLALVEGWKSVNTDPANYSGHRLLADSYSSLPRHEIARVSELLQAQLLQPININPLQPQLAATNLAILEGAGPSNLSYNEFNPLFTRNQVALQANGVVGSNDTWGEDLVVSGIQGKLSYSVGQFHFETDGFRDNNDLEHDIYNVFAQASLSPKSNVQLELRSQDTDSGDIEFRFDEFFPTDRRSTEIDSGRIGYHFAPTRRSDVLISVAYQDRTEESFTERFDSVSFGPLVLERRKATDTIADAIGYTAEAQYLFDAGSWNLTSGAGYFRQNASLKGTSELSFVGSLLPPLVTPRQDDLDADHKNAYIYSTFRISPKMVWTLGGSYDRFEDQNTERNQLNPKLGLILSLAESTTLRFAAFRTLKRAQLSNQTVEPTQVAGFNQFFDDLNGSDTKRYGIALDQRFSENLYSGIELTRRQLDVPRIPPPEGEEQDEDFHRAYIYWTPSSKISFSAEYQFDDFERDVPRNRDLGPNKLTTQSVPVRFGYYASNRLFSAIKLTYVRQHVEFAESTTPPDFRVIEDDEDFFVSDFEVGYRLPKRRGIASFLVKNLFDEEFDFQDRSFQAQTDFGATSVTPMYVPERTMFLKLTLAF